MLKKPKKRPKKSRALTKRERDVYAQLEREQKPKGCVICGRKHPLQRHHIRGASGRQTYIGNVVYLCSLILGDDSCHGKVESNMRYWKPKLIDIANEIHNIDLPYHYIYKESD
jgi:hypothetical protein